MRKITFLKKSILLFLLIIIRVCCAYTITFLLILNRHPRCIFETMSLSFFCPTSKVSLKIAPTITNHFKCICMYIFTSLREDASLVHQICSVQIISLWTLLCFTSSPAIAASCYQNTFVGVHLIFWRLYGWVHNRLALSVLHQICFHSWMCRYLELVPFVLGFFLAKNLHYIPCLSWPCLRI